MVTTPVTAEVVAVFVDERDGGNLAGVVLDPPDLSEAQMQSIAAQLGFPETAFLTEVDGGFRFDVFTPNTRVADCGHATIGSFGLLAQRERFSGSTIKYTTAGPREIRLGDDGSVSMEQLPARFESGPDPRAVAASLGLNETATFTHAPTVARHDVAFLLVGVSDRETLAAIVPDMRAIEAISVAADVFGYYVFAEPVDGVDATIRMFAPRIAIPEESATGMAAGMLAAFLHGRAGHSLECYRFDQGEFMHPPSPSRLNATLDASSSGISRVWVGGFARTREVRTLDV
ncbi:MAG: PhzF family phenazine biosynthesis protein [Candidatus Velthaea sp.]